MMPNASLNRTTCPELMTAGQVQRLDSPRDPKSARTISNWLSSSWGILPLQNLLHSQIYSLWHPGEQLRWLLWNPLYISTAFWVTLSKTRFPLQPVTHASTVQADAGRTAGLLPPLPVEIQYLRPTNAERWHYSAAMMPEQMMTQLLFQTIWL